MFQEAVWSGEAGLFSSIDVLADQGLCCSEDVEFVKTWVNTFQSIAGLSII